MRLLRTVWTMIQHRQAEVLWQHDPEPCEFFHGFRSFCWGLWVLNPWHPLFMADPKAGLWYLRVAPAGAWGAGMLALGFWVMLGIAVGTHRSRRVAQFVQFLLWAVITAGAYLADAASGVWTLHAITAGCCAWVYLRIGRYSHASHP